MLLTIEKPVGKNRANKSSDVKKIQALLNVFNRKKGLSIINITGVFDEKTSQSLLNFKKSFQHKQLLDESVIPNGNTFKVLKEFLAKTFTVKSVSPPKEGALTWNSEGNEGGRFHSRKLHVPSENSGLTLGRGYDLKLKSITTIRRDLAFSGIKQERITVLLKAKGLKGAQARSFIIDNDLLDFELTTDAQIKLFKISYNHEKSEVIRICKKLDVVNRYGVTDWDNLDEKIKEVLVDLKFRGDYSPVTRVLIQPIVVRNDVKAFKEVMSNRVNWQSVPQDRFEARAKFLQ
ncbi:hypothetical protein [Vibrio rotiferianus]|uniref:hypothetical protein n=1 Tax=Vibrio rotiferianus TaxID=190895 RepID=UPI0038B2EEA4